jgi:uncharacterized protein
MRRLAVLAALLLTGATAPAFAGSISVDGHGEVTVSPDMATINSGVLTQGTTAREALDANSEAMADLIATLKESGIEARDIQTSGITVSPNYVYSEERDDSGYTLPPKITGYQVGNTVTVIVRDIAELGAVLDKSVTVGANAINGVTFSVSDMRTVLDDARKEAFEDARRKAELYATAAGTPLGDIESISEGANAGQPQPFPMYDRAAAQAAPVPVEAGELTLGIDVTVRWETDTEN